eukprot:5675596-Pyramimonas_sp.AAC.1
MGKEPKVGKHRGRAFDWELIATTLEPFVTVPEFLEYGNKMSESPMQTENAAAPGHAQGIGEG